MRASLRVRFFLLRRSALLWAVLSLINPRCSGPTALTAQADDWSIRGPSGSDRGPRGSSSAVRPRPRAPQLPREERVYREALADPLSEILVDELIAIERGRGGIDALRARLVREADERSRVLLALIDYREADEVGRDRAVERLEHLAANGERLAAVALAQIAGKRADTVRERMHLRRAIELSPPGAEKDELRERLARRALDARDLDEARSEVEALMESRPRDADQRATWAGEFASAGAHEDAKRWIDTAIALRRGDMRSLIPLRIERARILHGAGESEAALGEVEGLLKQATSAAYRMSLYELELEIHRALGTLEDLADRHASRLDLDAAILGARLYEELGRDEAASKAYRRALRSRPGDRDLRAAYARLLARMGRIDDVLGQYERLVRETRSDPYFTRELALLYDRLGRRADAIALFERAVKQAPRSVELARVEAEVRESFGDLEGMRNALERWKRAAPRDPEPRIVLAASHLAEGAEERAVAELKPLAPRGAAAPDAAIELAQIYLDLDLVDHAEALLREVLARVGARDPREREVRLLLAEALIRPRPRSPALRGQRRAEAIAIYESILKDGKTPSDQLQRTRRLLARLLKEDRRLSPTIALLEARLEQDPKDEATRLMLIEAYLARGDADLPKAAALLESRDEGATENGAQATIERLERLIEIRQREGAREEEMALIKELIELEPSRSDTRIERVIELATALYLDEEALHYAEMATRRNPRDAAAHKRLGAFYLERSRLHDAAGAYKKALALDEFDLETLEALGRIALRMNSRDEARDYALRMLRLSGDDDRIRAAGLMALRLSSRVDELEELERMLVSVSSGVGANRVHRSLLLPIYEALARMEGAEVDRQSLGRRALGFLIEQLFDGDPSTIRRSLALLAELAPSGAGDAIMRFSRSDADAGLRAEALLTYARLGIPISKSDAKAFLSSEVPRLRRAAAWLIHQRGDGPSRRALLDSPDAEIRALGFLSFFHRPDVVLREKILAAVESGETTELRASATLALSRLGVETDVLRITAKAYASSPIERAAALYALQFAAFGDPRRAETNQRDGTSASNREALNEEALLALLVARLDPDPALREIADAALRLTYRIPDSLGEEPRSRSILQRIVEPPLRDRWAPAHMSRAASGGDAPAPLSYGRDTMIQAVRIALHGSTERAISAMRELLRPEEDPWAFPASLTETIVDAMTNELNALLLRDETEIRARAAALLARASSDETHAELIEDLWRRGDEETLRRALVSIAQRVIAAPGPRLIALLQEIIEEPSDKNRARFAREGARGEIGSSSPWPVRQAAILALRRASSEELGAFFEKIARRDTHAVVRAEAVSALASIPSSRGRLSELSEDHPDPWIREQAKNAIHGSIN